MRTRRRAVYQPRKSSDFAQNRDWLHKQARVYNAQLTHHTQLAKACGDHAKLLRSLERNGHVMAKPLIKRAINDAKHHDSMAAVHQRLLGDINKELIAQKTTEHQYNTVLHTGLRNRRTRADVPATTQQGDVNSPASAAYYSGVGINIYNRIVKDLRDNTELKEFIDNSNNKKLSRLAIEHLQKHPLYPRMKKYFDIAKQIAEKNHRTPERLGTITNGPPGGGYYDDKQFGSGWSNL